MACRPRSGSSARPGPGASRRRSSYWSPSHWLHITSKPTRPSGTTRWPWATTKTRHAPPASTCAAQRMMLYTISGLMAGIAGLIFTHGVNTGDPTAGLSYELLAITAAIIGGTNLFGGRGSILGTMIGALIMGVLQNGLNLDGRAGLLPADGHRCRSDCRGLARPDSAPGGGRCNEHPRTFRRRKELWRGFRCCTEWT